MMKRNWIKTFGYLMPRDYEKMEDMNIDVEPELTPFRFDLNEVIAYNESDREGCTTIRLSSYFEITVNIHIDCMDSLMNPETQETAKEYLKQCDL